MAKEKELINQWSTNLRSAIAFRQRIYTDSHWDRFEGYFRNKFPKNFSPGQIRVLRDHTMVREARKFVPKVVFGNPYLKVKPLAGRTPLHAKVLERVINGILEIIGIGETLDRGALSVVQHGTTFFKPLYDAEYVPSYDRLITEGFSEGAYDTKRQRREFRQNVFPGLPSVIWQHPKSVIFPEMISSFSDAPWVAYQYLRPVEDVRKDERLRNNKDIQPTSYRYEEMDPFLSNDTGAHEYLKEQVLMTEIRDKRTGHMIIFAEDHSKVVYDERDVMMEVLGGKIPNYSLTFNDNTDYAWGTSDIEMVEEDTKELVDIRTQHAINRRLRNVMFLYHENAIDKDEVLRAVQGLAGAGIKIKGSLETGFKVISMPSQSDWLLEAREVSHRIKEHFGAAAFATHPTSRRGSAEVQGSMSDSSIPVNRASEKVRKLTVEMAKDISKMIFAFFTEDTVVDILSPVLDSVKDPETGQLTTQDVTRQIWVSFKGADLKGNFDYTMQTASGRFQDSRESKSEAIALIQELRQEQGVNMQEVWRQLGDRFDSLDIERIFTPIGGPGQPMPIDQLLNREVGNRLALPQGGSAA